MLTDKEKNEENSILFQLGTQLLACYMLEENLF